MLSKNHYKKASSLQMELFLTPFAFKLHLRFDKIAHSNFIDSIVNRYDLLVKRKPLLTVCGKKFVLEKERL